MPSKTATILFCLPMIGCAAAGVHVANPAATGTLAPAQAAYVDRVETGLARQLAVDPRTMEDTATLVRLDGQSVCFDIVARLSQANGSELAVPHVTLDPSNIHLTFDGGSLGTPTVEARPITRAPITGEHTELYTNEGDPQRTIHSEASAVSMEIVSGGGVACFAHHGAILASNRHLRLSYTELNFTPAFDFQLDASPSPTAWPARPIVAPGYERLSSL